MSGITQDAGDSCYVTLHHGGSLRFLDYKVVTAILAISQVVNNVQTFRANTGILLRFLASCLLLKWLIQE